MLTRWDKIKAAERMQAHIEVLPMLAPARCPFDEPMLFRAPDPDPPLILDDDQTWTARGPP